MNLNVTTYIKEIKSFWEITNFEEEILNWKYDHILKSNNIVIGHLNNSHKGNSVGDILPYTLLPKLLKQKYKNCTVKVPDVFWPFFKDNKYVDGIDNNVQMWGSLGTWGHTLQRTCNVWGIQTYNFKPIVYKKRNIKKNTIIICISSKTGGHIINIHHIDEIIKKLKKDYYCVQLATLNDPLLSNVDKYIFNIEVSNLTDIISSFEYYIGVQNSIYHLSKSIGLNIIGILPENIDPFFVKLPLLTQCNYKEIEMLPDIQKIRAYEYMMKINSLKKNIINTYHVGWLYPDTPHLTMNFKNETIFCEEVTYDNIIKSMNNKCYPFNDVRLWDFQSYGYLWAHV